jgi:hypothetical protein
MQMFINKNGQQLGPFDEAKVAEMLQSGQLSPNDFGIKQGESSWSKLENLFPANAIPIKVEANFVGNQISKLNWILFYLVSFFAFVSGITVLFFLFATYRFQDLCYYLGYKPPEIMPLFLIIGVVLLIQFLLIHNIMISLLSKKLWNGIGLETIYSRVYGKVKRRIVMRRYRSNRWVLFQEHFERFLKNNNLPTQDVKMTSFAMLGSSFEFPSSLLLFPFQPFIFLIVISQATNVINSMPLQQEQIINQIDLGR